MTSIRQLSIVVALSAFPLLPIAAQQPSNGLPAWVTSLHGEWEGTLTMQVGAAARTPFTISVSVEPWHDHAVLFTMTIQSDGRGATERLLGWSVDDRYDARVFNQPGGYAPRLLLTEATMTATFELPSAQNDNEGSLRTRFALSDDGELHASFANTRPGSTEWLRVWDAVLHR